MPPARRRAKNSGWPRWFYRDSRTGIFYFQRQVPGENKPRRFSYKTDDLTEALTRHLLVLEQIKKEEVAPVAPLSPTLEKFAREWLSRINKLRSKTGKELAKATRKDYEYAIKRLLQDDALCAKRLTAVRATDIRGYLRPWRLDNPSYHNSTLAALSRLFMDAVDDGLLDDSPAKGVRRAAVQRREVYVTDDEFIAIRTKAEGLYGEWFGRVIDLHYLSSHNPVDVLAYEESDLDGNVLRFHRNKTGQLIELEVNDDFKDLWGWFRQYKREHRLFSTLLVPAPPGFSHLRPGRPLRREWISRRFTEAARGCDLGRAITIRDLRPKGLTDEFLRTGEVSSKGGHKTESMKRYYVRVELPVKGKSTIERL